MKYFIFWLLGVISLAAFIWFAPFQMTSMHKWIVNRNDVLRFLIEDQERLGNKPPFIVVDESNLGVSTSCEN